MAIANRYTGKDLYAEFITADAIVPLTGDQLSFTLSKTVDLYDVTPGDTIEKQYAANIKEGEVEIELLDVGSAAAAAIDTVLDAGVVGTLVYAPKGTSSYYTNPKRGFKVIVEGKSFDYPYDDVVEVELQFKKAGSAIFGGTATWNYSDEALLYLQFENNLNNSIVRSPKGLDFTTKVAHDYIFPKYRQPQVSNRNANSRNLLPNPSFETNLSGWSTVGTIIQSDEVAKFGSQSMKCTYTGNPDNNVGAYGYTFPVESAVTVSLYVYIPTGWDGTYVHANSEGYAGVTGTVQIVFDATLKDQWQRGEMTFTPAEADLVGAPVVMRSDMSSGKYFFIDGVQFEYASAATPYIDGDQDNCTWIGTDHASVSYREEPGGMLQSAELTTNLVTNTSAETGTTGWSSYQSTTTQSSDFAFVGGYSFKNVITVSGPAAFGQYQVTVSGAPLDVLTYSASAWVWVNADVASRTFFRVYLAMLGGATGVNFNLYTDHTLSAGWNYVHTTQTVDEVDRTGVEPIFYLRDADTGDEFYIDAIQLEQKNYPTPYCDGSLGNGHHWAGTAYASKSIRTVNRVHYANDDIFRSHPSNMSISWWAAILDEDAVNPTYPYWFHFGNSTDNRIFCTHDPKGTFGFGSAHAVIGFVDTAEVPVAYNADLGLPTGHGVFDHYAAVFTALDTTAPVLTTYRNGTAIGGATADYAIDDLSASVGRLALGAYLSSNFEMNGFLDEFLVFDRALSATEVTAIYNRGAAGNPA